MNFSLCSACRIPLSTSFSCPNSVLNTLFCSTLDLRIISSVVLRPTRNVTFRKLHLFLPEYEAMGKVHKPSNRKLCASSPASFRNSVRMRGQISGPERNSYAYNDIFCSTQQDRKLWTDLQSAFPRLTRLLIWFVIVAHKYLNFDSFLKGFLDNCCASWWRDLKISTAQFSAPSLSVSLSPCGFLCGILLLVYPHCYCYCC